MTQDQKNHIAENITLLIASDVRSIPLAMPEGDSYVTSIDAVADTAVVQGYGTITLAPVQWLELATVVRETKPELFEQAREIMHDAE